MNIEPYGTEALSTLRIEMGHVAGSEIDGRVISSDLSLEGMLSKKKDFIGKRSLNREAFLNPNREKIVGVVPLDKKSMIPEGSHLVSDSNASLPNPKLGHISARTREPGIMWQFWALNHTLVVCGLRIYAIPAGTRWDKLF